jgi:hypothetical protein
MQNLKKLAEQFGISFQEPIDSATYTPIEPEDLAINMAEIGIPGTRFGWETDRSEYNAELGPYAVRGMSSNPGLYEELWRSEPLVRDSVSSYQELLAEGHWEVHVPSEAPPKVQAFAKWHERKLMNIDGGWPAFIDSASSFLIFGFALHEIVWGADNDRPFIEKLAFREQSTVSGWIVEDGRDLMGVRFEAGGQYAKNYTIPKSKLLLNNVAARGLNYEGVPPLRAVVRYIQLKQILVQCAGAAAEKYGCPVTYIRTDKDFLDKLPGFAPDDADISATTRAMTSMRAAELGVFELPDGVIAEIQAPPGQMPDLLDLIRYVDEQIAAVYSNEGGLLGLSSAVGSYALGEVKERETLRTIPAYARRISEPISNLLRALAIEEFGELEYYPKLVFRFDGLRDKGRFIDDLAKLYPNAPISSWDPAFQDAVFTELGIEKRKVKEEEAPEEISKVSLNGAQIQGVLSIVEKFKLGIMERQSAVELLSLSFPFTRPQAALIVGGEPDAIPRTDGPESSTGSPEDAAPEAAPVDPSISIRIEEDR